jgi:C4-dicarboxylate-specific signal transduction histidine kinase
MIEFIRNLFSSDFMPHGHCFFWLPEIVWLHAISDGLITLAYYLIPVVLFYFVRKRRDVPFHWMFIMFGVFILSCGTTHLMEIWTLWNGTYRLSGVIKAITAVASVATAALLIPLIPRALSLPSPAQLRAANLKLEREIGERLRVQKALEKAGRELEIRVEQRTAELASANEQLRAEINERKLAEERLQQGHAQLAHMARVTLMGELAASIAHEVNQPLTAIVTNGNACLRWLNRDEPDLDEARAAATRVVAEGDRAGKVIGRIRSLIKKGPARMSTLDMNELIREVLNLTNHELVRHSVSVRTELDAGLPSVIGDSVQLQQVILNLMMNGIEATSGMADGARHLLVTSRRQGADQIVVALKDSGVGIDPGHVDELFSPFFTTKAAGMGMGLSISRSIIEAHDGRLWAAPNEEGPGATLQFSLPVLPVANRE